MPNYIAIFDWSLFNLPPGLPEADLLYDTHPNVPGSPDHSPTSTTWMGQTFTYNGGNSTLLEINDDDPDFEDAYVETGQPQTLAQDTLINGTLYPAGSTVENEFSLIDAAGTEIWVVRINGENVGFTYPADAAPTAGDTFTATNGRDGDPADSADNTGSAEPYAGIICFMPGAQIETPGGLRRVEEITAGTSVTTLHAGPKTVRWVARRKVNFRDNPDFARPIQIKAGAFGEGVPFADLVVSPQHRFLGLSPEGECFVPAIALVDQAKVRIMHGKKSVDYIHFAFDQHEVVVANGVPTESCYLGPMMLADVTPSQQPQMKALFPGLDFTTGQGYGPTARPTLKVQVARALLAEKKLSFRSIALTP